MNKQLSLRLTWCRATAISLIATVGFTFAAAGRPVRALDPPGTSPDSASQTPVSRDSNPAIPRSSKPGGSDDATEVRPQTDRPVKRDTRNEFLRIERIARLSAKGQRYKLPVLYRELAPRYMNPVIEGVLSGYPRNILDRSAGFGNPGGPHMTVWAGQLSAVAEKMSPEQVADRLEIRLWWAVAARARALHIFRTYPKATSKLIAADLKTGTKQSVGRAAMTILSLKLRDFTPELLACFAADDETSKPAGHALLFLSDPAIVEPLLDRVEDDPRFLIRCAGLFQGPLSREPAEPQLLKLLQSEDSEVRYHAAYALSECRDARLATPAAKLAADREPRFRSLAAILGLRLPAKAFRSTREEFLPLLSDREENVRFDALRCFAGQKDLAAGGVLLKLLQLDTLPEGRKVTVMQAMSSLTGSTFQYNLHKWGDGTPGNKLAIEKLQDWLTKNKQAEVRGKGVRADKKMPGTE